MHWRMAKKDRYVQILGIYDGYREKPYQQFTGNSWALKSFGNYCPSKVLSQTAKFDRNWSVFSYLFRTFLLLTFFFFFLYPFLSVFLWRRRISILVRISISNFLFLSRWKKNKGGWRFKKNGFGRLRRVARSNGHFIANHPPKYRRYQIQTNSFRSFLSLRLFCFLFLFFLRIL